MYLFIYLLWFIGILLIFQLIMFELQKRKVDKSNNMNWYLSLDRPFNYNRTGYMVFICVLCYCLAMGISFTFSWFFYLILFIALGIVADAIVQYLTLAYGKKRCAKQIEEAQYMKNELARLSEAVEVEDHSYVTSSPRYDELDYLRHYIKPTDHVAFITADQGKLAYEFEPKGEATFVLEPYGQVDTIKYPDDPSFKVTQLTSSGQMPFKDNKLDIVFCKNCTYTKEEVNRVLKNNGYYIVNQNGTANLKEFVQMYMPFKLKKTWDAYTCAQSLEELGMHVIEKIDDYGTIRFNSVEAIYTYFMEVSPDLADINKYQVFYINAMKAIREQRYFDLTTHKFLVVAQKTGVLSQVQEK